MEWGQAECRFHDSVFIFAHESTCKVVNYVNFQRCSRPPKKHILIKWPKLKYLVCSIYIFYPIANGNCTHVCSPIHSSRHSFHILYKYEPLQLLTAHSLKSFNCIKLLLLEIFCTAGKQHIKWFGAQPMRCLALTHFRFVRFASHKFHCIIRLINCNIPFEWQMLGDCGWACECRISYVCIHSHLQRFNSEGMLNQFHSAVAKALSFKCLNEHWSIFNTWLVCKPGESISSSSLVRIGLFLNSTFDSVGANIFVGVFGSLNRHLRCNLWP